mgnify:CR=1 FL=1
MANGIKLGNNTVSFKVGSTDVDAIYLGNTLLYSGATPPTPSGQTPCYEVVSDISSASSEFEDVYVTTSDKWYKLNNLNQYEEYGKYGSSTGASETTYDGKLSIYNGYEYIYSGGSWNNIGAVSGTSVLPQGYTQLEYIQSNSTSKKSFIKLDYHATENTRVVADMQPMTGASGNPRLFGCGWWNGLGYQINIENGGYNFKFGQTNSWYYISSPSANYNRHVYDFNNDGKIYIDSTLTQGDSIPTTSFTSTDNFGVMGYLRNGSDTDQNEEFYGKMYSFKLYESGTLLYDLVPAKRNSDDAIGAYDIVNNVFYDAFMNGPFLGGGSTETYPIYYDEMQDPPNNLSFSSMTEAEEYECPWVGMKATIVGDRYIFSGDSQSGYEWVYTPSRLPQGYTEVEYIQNTGTSYIDTNFVPNQDTRIVCDMQMVTVESNNYPRLYGAGDWNSEDSLVIDFQYGYMNISWLGYNGWKTVYTVETNTDRRVYDLNKNELYVDEIIVGSTAYTSSTATDNLGIFTYILNGAPSTGGSGWYWGKEHFKGKMYSCQIYDNGTLVRDFVPCINPNNVVGAYDIVNDVFYTVPIGYTTDQFIAGSIV